MILRTLRGCVTRASQRVRSLLSWRIDPLDAFAVYSKRLFFRQRFDSSMNFHDPSKFVRSLSAKLSARSRHVCMLLGAGASKASGLPDVTDLQKIVLERLEEDERSAFSTQLEGKTLEEAITRLRRIASIISGDSTIDGLTASRAEQLDRTVCHSIVDALTDSNINRKPMDSLAAWATRANYTKPLEIFTINYDLLVESALERIGACYFDGFIGVLAARFHTELVETPPLADSVPLPASFVRLWKLHGSVNWEWTLDQEIVRRGNAVKEGNVAAIYPSELKYTESRRVPFIVLQDRLRRALYEPETLLLISGYSFGDDHLNEHIFNAAMHCPRSEYVAFVFDEIPEILSERAEATPNLQVIAGHEAIIGGKRGKWSNTEDVPDSLKKDGQFSLRDFRHLAGYLAGSDVAQHESRSESV